MKRDDAGLDDATPEHSSLSDDQVETLLRLTGRRPTVPADRADRVRAAVRAHWQATVHRGSHRRRFWGAAALATAATIAAVVGVGTWRRTDRSAATSAVGRVEAVAGPASAASNGSTASLRRGDPVTAPSELKTEKGGRVAMRLTSGHSVRLDEGTLLRILSDRTVALDRGTLYVDSASPHGAASRPLEVQTPRGILRDVGTQFEVRMLDGTVRVRVREGVVALDGRGDTIQVTAGHELAVDAEGRTRSREVAPFEGEWAWVAEITPMMELQGRSLREFLDWIVRERGLRLEFASPDLAASASGIALNGSIDGMTLDQALQSVLPTCRVTHRIDGDVLRVEPL